ncbi:MAG: beta-ketoacyl synthase chain length factor [Gammaproteobacteria bacterium]|nr:beta-ketoacyl synthase chain length factor [Gammaproteobacteria bacterium]
MSPPAAGLVTVYARGLSVIAPGLDGWEQSQSILHGERLYVNQPLAAFAPELLPRNERRRATGAIKLALRAAEQLALPSGIDRQSLRAVFASSGGDGEIINSICTALAQPQRAVSPTQFHNSVHNSPAGYWAIATICHSSSVSLSAHDGSFAAGLLEAATTALIEGGPVLLVAYDYPPPEPLSQVRGFCAPFAAAMLIDAHSGARALASFGIALTHGEREDQIRDKELEYLRTGNPAARALPLLQAIARQEVRRVVLPYLPDAQLAVEVRPADGLCADCS